MPRCLTTDRRTFFSSRVIGSWNSLPQHVISECLQEQIGQTLVRYGHIKRKLQSSSSSSTRTSKYTEIPVTDALELAGDRSFWRQIARCYGWTLRVTMMIFRQEEDFPTAKNLGRAISTSLLFNATTWLKLMGVFSRSSKRPANFQQMYSKYTC